MSVVSGVLMSPGLQDIIHPEEVGQLAPGDDAPTCTVTLEDFELSGSLVSLVRAGDNLTVQVLLPPGSSRSTLNAARVVAIGINGPDDLGHPVSFWVGKTMSVGTTWQGGQTTLAVEVVTSSAPVG